MGLLKMLAPSFDGRGTAMGLKVTGEKIFFTKHVSAELGLRSKTDRVHFGFGASKEAEAKAIETESAIIPDRLYILNDKQEKDRATAEGQEPGLGWQLVGEVDKRRYVRDQGIVNAANLSDGEYTMIKDADGWYLEFNPNVKKAKAPVTTDATGKKPASGQKPMSAAEKIAENKKKKAAEEAAGDQG